jgi:DNA-binding LacI/PurR family transcriptional regulator
MANANDMDGGSLVPLDLPPQHIPILRDRLTAWLDGVREDLESPDEVQQPDQAWQEARAFERLLTALTTGKICVPDEAARAVIEASAAAHDKESDYADVVAAHDALHDLLGVLGGARP